MSKKRRHGRHNPIYRNGARPDGVQNAPDSRDKSKAWLVSITLLVLAGLMAYAFKGPGKGGGTAANSNASSVAVPKSSAAQVPPPKPPPPGPRIQFATRTYNFGKVEGDRAVDCTFVFTNVGTQLLELAQVSPSCSCLRLGNYTRQVPPGQTGTIGVTYNSRFFTGHFGKSVYVACNDVLETNIHLQITGDVWRPIEVSPINATINLNADIPSNAATVKILSHIDDPLLLSNLECTLNAVSVELQTNQPGREYQLLVKTLPPWPTNNMPGVIRIKTTATNMPLLEVKTWVNYQPVVAAIPSQVRLPPGPLTNIFPYTLWVRNNGTNPLVLADPSVNTKGVDVQIKEDQVGTQFTVNLNFPAGFDATKGTTELSIKSNHPQYPVVKVPIIQAPLK